MNDTAKVTANGTGRQTVWVIAALIVGLAGGLGVGAVLWRGGDDVEQAKLDAQRKAEIAASGYKAADLLLVAAEGLTRERGLTYTALRANGHIPAENKDDVSAARSQADDALGQAIELVANHLDLDRDTSFMQTFAQTRKALETIRAEIDRRNAEDQAGSATALADRCFQRTSRLLSSTEQMLELVHIKIRSVGLDPDTSVSLKLQRLALLMTDFAGRERGAVSGAIADGKPLNESFSQWALPAYQARINGIWASSKSIANAHALSPEIDSIIAEIDKKFFGDLETMRVAIRKASDAGEPYPITADEWFAKTSSIIERMVVLGREAGKFAQKKLSGQQARAGARP